MMWMMLMTKTLLIILANCMWRIDRIRFKRNENFLVTAYLSKYKGHDNDKDDVDDQNGADCLGKLHVADRSLEIKSRSEVKKCG